MKYQQRNHEEHFKQIKTPNEITICIEEIHSVGTINNVETSYFTQLKMCYLMTTFWCPSDILITSWLFTAWRSTWPGNHLVLWVAELVGSCIPIHPHQSINQSINQSTEFLYCPLQNMDGDVHPHRCLPDPKCLFYPSGLSLCLSVDHFRFIPVDNMVLFHGMVCDSWLVSYTALPCPVPAVKESTSFLCSLILRPNFLPVSPT